MFVIDRQKSGKESMSLLSRSVNPRDRHEEGEEATPLQFCPFAQPSKLCLENSKMLRHYNHSLVVTSQEAESSDNINLRQLIFNLILEFQEITRAITATINFKIPLVSKFSISAKCALERSKHFIASVRSYKLQV